MSWLDKIKNQLSITTGDGTVFTPEWLNARKLVDYNVAQFEFPSIGGTLVYRGTPKGTKYHIELYFQGAANLDAAANFQDSAADNRSWILSHPFYGQLVVQPISLEFDNSSLNVTKITGTIIETIGQDYPQGRRNPVDVITADTVTVAQLASTAAADNEIVTKAPPSYVSAKTINATKNNLSSFLKSVQNAVNQQTTDYQNYLNVYNQALSNIDKLMSSSSSVFNLLQATVNLPGQFILPIVNRYAVLQNQLYLLRQNITSQMSRLDKLMFATLGSGCIGGMCLACASPQAGDFTYADSVYNVIEQLLNTYNQYLTDLDGIQTPDGGSTDSFMPDADALTALDELVDFTLSNLFAIAVNGLQQRSILLEKESNWILLTQRFLGLDPLDANLTTMMEWNNAGLSTMLRIKKGTKIVYYV